MLSKVSKNKPLTIEEQYKIKTLHEAILDIPDTYVGSIVVDQQDIFTYDDETNTMTKKSRQIVPGLYKIFDEILVNASDNTTRDAKCNTIKVTINEESGEIIVFNNGSSIPIEIHKELKIYVPEMIFGNLLTSGNYDKTEKITGGKNGFGAKLANIYSKVFDILIIDSQRKLQYFQRFRNNMFDKDDPIITPITSNVESSTTITFNPDYNKFGLKKLTSDMISLFKKRVYDIAATTQAHVKVYYNNNLINIKSFEDYIKLFYNEDDQIDVIYQELPRWTIGVVFDPNAGFQHMTFVNHISTYQGGTHLNYIVNQLVDKLTKNIMIKNPTLKIKPSLIKDNITVFINCVIEDPAFDSQIKATLTTKVSDFKIKCDLDEKFISKISKTGLLNEIIQVAKNKQLSELEHSDGKKNNNIHLAKLEKAKFAGTKRSEECTLILTEGDSAKSYAISGLEIIGRDFYGVFPLKGKLLNVRDATPNQLLNNEEIKNLKIIMGFRQNTVYTDCKKLNYGKILILTDSDVDGSHIKGLVINFIHFFWPSLLKIDGFIQTIATPTIKIYKPSDIKKLNPVEIFYTASDYKSWCDGNPDICNKYIIKYFKGLGTSSDMEAKESFINIKDKLIDYVWYNQTTKINNLISTPIIKESKLDDDDNNSSNSKTSKTSKNSKNSKKNILNDDNKNDLSHNAILLAFAKQNVNERKEWIRQSNPANIIKTDVRKVTYDEFVMKELIHFSVDDTSRSIPNLIDGLKPSQRKILFGAFKRKLDNGEIKVAQLSGYISEHTGYHHGEASLQGAIINMAQDFCGTNNINLLTPNGNFGSRRLGGKDQASPRYIFTQLNQLSRLIYIKKDEPLLKYNIEEGDSVEPETYYPIIPMILINGSEGIGTGFSTNIPPYNPLAVINNIGAYLHNPNIDELDELIPWYKGFEGTIVKKDDYTFHAIGKYKILNESSIHITELPVNVWTQDYVSFILELIEKQELIKDYENLSGNYKIDIKLYFIDGELQNLIKSSLLEKKLKLISIIKTSNMHLYKDANIVKYSNANQILKDYTETRLVMYSKRKIYTINVLKNELNILLYRKKFISDIISTKIIINNREHVNIIEELIKYKYPKLLHDINSDKIPSYDYLTNLPLFALSANKKLEYENEYNDKIEELDVYTNTSVKDLWIRELNILKDGYIAWFDESEMLHSKTSKKKVKSSLTSKTKKSIIVQQEITNTKSSKK